MTWREDIASSIRTIDDLEKHVRLAPGEMESLRKVVERHPMSVTPYYLSLIDWDDPADPIRKMAIPSVQERSPIGSYDTSGEKENTKLPGLQHKYARPALVLVTNRCAVYCRHCFRKRLVGLPTEEILERFEDAACYIERHEEIDNVLLSGGDPLVLATSTIAAFLERLSAIEHLRFIRIGTRIPVVCPNRILEDRELTTLLSGHSRPSRRIYVVAQFNHPREITESSAAAIDALVRSGVIINNQTVLLSGVNDDPAVLADLQGGLVGVGVAPYYVFQCRPVKRVKSVFQVPLSRGYAIVEAAKARLNGHAKRFKYVMSHRSGKIEIVGVAAGEIYLRYHEATSAQDDGRFFKRKIVPGAGWLDDLDERPQERATPDSAGLAVT
jgi:lysine 2,3-aminomutase